MAGKDSSYGATASPAPANVQVIAPATLEAGYTFDAMYEGVTFAVTVPSGGVSKGQRFIVPFTPPLTDAIAVAIPTSSYSTSAEGSKQQQHGIPTGIWRDGLCDCFRFGPFHPQFILSWCFRSFLMGQIMTRMKMTWLGQRTRNGDNGNLNDSLIETDERWKNTFRNIAVVTFVFGGTLLLTTVNPAVSDSTLNQSAYYNQLSGVDKTRYIINSWISTLFGIYLFYILIQLRATLRYVYSIPEESCLCWYQLGIFGTNPRDGVCGSGSGDSNKLCTAGVPIGWEDICCALWCQLCIVGQMARHTVDYEKKDAVFCNNVA